MSLKEVVVVRRFRFSARRRLETAFIFNGARQILLPDQDCVHDVAMNLFDRRDGLQLREHFPIKSRRNEYLFRPRMKYLKSELSESLFKLSKYYHMKYSSFL